MIQEKDRENTNAVKLAQELKKKKERGISDGLELKRDLSTYEHKFCKNSNLKDKLL